MFGAISMHISGAKLDANFFVNLSISDIAGYFGFNLTVDKPHESITGLYIQAPSPLVPLITFIQTVLADTGKKLLELGYKKLSDFILDTLKNSQSASASSSKPSASTLVERLVQCFPAFDDRAQFNGVNVYFFKKAQFLVSELYTRFKSSHPAQFDFADIAELTVFVDNVVPAVLQSLKILVLPAELASAIENSEDLILTHKPETSKKLITATKPTQQQQTDFKPTEPELSVTDPSDTPTIAHADIQLRAVAVSACEEIVSLARKSLPWASDLTAKEFDYYIWRLGKEGDFRKFVRHRVQSTYYY